MKILFVEDNDDNVYMLKNRLLRAGFTVIVAISGMQGITMATSEQPDLILPRQRATMQTPQGLDATQSVFPINGNGRSLPRSQVGTGA
jgi:CheY-like chemotaxis protein